MLPFVVGASLWNLHDVIIALAAMVDYWKHVLKVFEFVADRAFAKLKMKGESRTTLWNRYTGSGLNFVGMSAQIGRVAVCLYVSSAEYYTRIHAPAPSTLMCAQQRTLLIGLRLSASALVLLLITTSVRIFTSSRVPRCIGIP